MELTCAQRCVRYLKARPGVWIASGDIQRVGAAKSTYTPSNISRRLRELAESGQIEVKIDKGHAYYRYTGDDERKRLEAIKWFDSLPDSPVMAHNDLQHA